MRSFTLFVCFVFVKLTGLHAQSVYDSSLVSTTENNLFFNYARQPVSGYFQPYDYGLSQANWKFLRMGKIKSPQVPSTQQNFGFSSQGRRTLNTWVLSGYFGYTKEIQDSVGWKQVREITANPYYFGNIRKGNWNSDLFDAQIKITKPLLSDRLLLGLGVDYQLQQTIRLSDPRPSIDFFSLTLRAQAAYEFMPDIYIAAMVGTGETSELGQIKNYNASHDSFGQTEFNLYTLMGLGSYNLVQKRSYRLEGGLTSYGFSLYGTLGKFRFSHEFQLDDSQDRFTRKNSSGDEVIGDFYLKEYQNNTFVTSEISGWTLQGQLSYSVSEGNDFNHLFQGRNFEYFAKDLSLNLLAARPHYNFGVGLDYQSNAKEDFNASHFASWNRLVTKVSSQYIFQFERISIAPRVSIGTTALLDEKMIITSGQQNVFTEELLYPSFYAATQNNLIFETQLDFIIELKNYRVNPHIGYDHVFYTGELSEYWLGQPRNSQTQLSLGIKFIH